MICSQTVKKLSPNVRNGGGLINFNVKINWGGATVRCREYSRLEADPVRSSQPPVSSLGAEAARLGLSVGRLENIIQLKNKDHQIVQPL